MSEIVISRGPGDPLTAKRSGGRINLWRGLKRIISFDDDEIGRLVAAAEALPDEPQLGQIVRYAAPDPDVARTPA